MPIRGPTNGSEREEERKRGGKGGERGRRGREREGEGGRGKERERGRAWRVVGALVAVAPTLRKLARETRWHTPPIYAMPRARRFPASLVP